MFPIIEAQGIRLVSVRTVAWRRWQQCRYLSGPCALRRFRTEGWT